ncbi:ABC transporter substrate-binding protein [Lachnoclostridium phytofermentans]|uniref:Extracellular solute-binding protein family 1 n=1 Tax=Lachnoclostridium phytofermentans (strain ATCC 700394 / DSM 18823 / ISDg) TaxID=357809 RepID=A9KI82_LACP7|nr:extracellular solute-binding protein [Lachnoclostridium phytofermentans]ABX40916.1 extracellular solute-binding protein family 1 [Lachnoclostridium phytofermentans ISDg]
MRRFSKALALMLGITLVFTGCGAKNSNSGDGSKGNEGNTNNTSTVKPTEPAKTDSGKQNTIVVYSWEASLKEQNDKVIAAFESKYPNIKVDMQYPVENDNVKYTEKVDLLLLSGEKVDAVLESSVAKCVSKVQRNLYQPLDQFIQAEGINYDDVYSVNSQVDGSYYACPIDVTPWFIMMNKDMLDKAGLPVPTSWTWDDYREYAKKLTSGSGLDKIYGSYFHTWQNYGLMGVYSTKMDNAYYKADGSLNFDDPNLRDWLEFRYEMENVDETSVPLIDIKTSNLAYRNEFFGEKVAMLPTGTWMLAEIKDAEKWPHNFKTCFAPLPTWDNGAEGRTFSDTKMFSIPKSSKYPEDAYKFIRFYTTEGAYIRAGGLTAEKNMNLDTILPFIVGENPDALYDMDSVKNVLNNPKLEMNAPMTAPGYNAEIDSLFVEEIEKYLVGGETLDDCISNLNERGKYIVESFVE